MNLSKQMRLLQNKWKSNTGWPKRLEALEIEGLRGWNGQRIEFKFPIIAISGENGAGKSTILQSAASVYTDTSNWFASDFFPDTPWDQTSKASIRFNYREGDKSTSGSVRKPGDRWRGNPDRPSRPVNYIDLARIQPVSARTGYSKLAKASVKETSFADIDGSAVLNLSEIMGKSYSNGKMALTDADNSRSVPVLSMGGKQVSGFHQGAGEFTMTEFLQINPQKYSLVLIDEVETSLHPRAQRRLIRHLAELCRVHELQIILTTHSPYVLAELPSEARGYILKNQEQKEVVFGVSPEFAMTQMDEEQHPECDLYVEDARAQIMLQEILFKFAPELLPRLQIIPFGTASVGQALGIMANQNRFPRKSAVFLDGDQAPSAGCTILPGGDAPERVVFGALQKQNWTLLDTRTSRDFSMVADACNQAMTSSDHHEWVGIAASKMRLSGDTLWQIMASEWALNCLDEAVAEPVIKPIRDLFI